MFSKLSSGCLLTVGMCLAIGCGAESPESFPEENVESQGQALMLGSMFEPWYPPPVWGVEGAAEDDCPEYYSVAGNPPVLHWLNPDGERLQTFINDAVKKGRQIASSFAMLDCLMDVMSNGGIALRAEPTPGTWGPYCRPMEDPNCNAMTAGADGYGFGQPNTDPYNPYELDLLALADASVTQARRVWAQAQTNNRLRVSCHKPSVGGPQRNGPQTHVTLSDYTEEVISLDIAEFANTITDLNGGNAVTLANTQARLAGLIWHEAMHGHGYDHDGGGATLMRQVPPIVGACMWQVMLDSHPTVAHPNAQSNCIGTTCTGGAIPVVTLFPGTTCTCIPDPGVYTNNRVQTNRGTPSAMAVDGYGVMYRMNGADMQMFLFGAWTTIATGVESIYAGGDKAFHRKLGTLYRRDGAAWTSLGATGTNIKIDDLGRAIRIVSGSVKVVRPGTTTWENFGSPPGGATNIFAGGNQVYATTSNGNIYRWSGPTIWQKVGGPGADFAVDSYGVLYGLTPDRAAVYAFRNGAWQWVGSSQNGIIAGHRLYARNTADQIYELYPNGEWKFVTDSYSAWDAGGHRLVVKRGTTWYDYVLNGTSTIF